MEIDLERIAAENGGKLARKAGSGITGVAPLDSAGPSDLSFVHSPRFYAMARATRAGALLCPEQLPWFHGGQVVVPNPRAAMGSVLAGLEREMFATAPGVDPSARIHPSARMGASVHVGANAVVEEGALVGDGAVLHANCTILRNARVGRGSVIHPGAVVGRFVGIGCECVVGPNSSIGHSGFGVERLEDGTLRALAQAGRVEIGDRVEIGACCTVDRGTMGPTSIGEGTKMDNHCHVAHNVRIGRHCLLVAYAKIAGSTVIGDYVTIAEDVGITDNARIGDRARIGGGSRVYGDVAERAEVWGAPARELALERRIQAILSRLPRMREQLKDLLRRRPVEP